ncbi:MAG TPA: TlpA disulfide reductase family protein [Polyangiaceae bacterium]|nr:TlpA disulfide reductase family protein [Polyangiaceae bacterium]
MSQRLQAGRPSKPKDERITYLVIAIVMIASVLLGLLGLPRIGERSARTGAVAPEFSLPVVSGGDSGSRISLGAYRDTVVVLDFWATWCAPCAEQARVLEQFVAVRPPVEVVGVNQGEDLAVVQAYLAQHPSSYPIVLDTEQRVGDAYGVRGLPTLVVIDRNGRIAATVSGVISYGRLERLVAEAAASR